MMMNPLVQPTQLTSIELHQVLNENVIKESRNGINQGKVEGREKPIKRRIVMSVHQRPIARNLKKQLNTMMVHKRSVKGKQRRIIT
jgi:hypothetical protein